MLINIHKTVNVVLIFIFYITQEIIAQDDKATIITLPNGIIRGHFLQTAKGNMYLAFQQIPYASPPIGKLRFKDPTPPKNWEGILNATENTKVCYQSTPNDLDNEDCLYLNVYVPVNVNSSKTNRLPVLFYIYGGGFTKGDGTYVTWTRFLHRSKRFGFLSTEDIIISGNQALKDQNFALRWVNTNIHLFGGDPSKVTIMGESAGAASVGFHLISKKSKGMFRAAIMASGTSICSWAYQRRSKIGAYKLAAAFASTVTPNNSSEEVLKLLQSIPAADIRDANVTLEVPLQIGQGYTWAPVIEPKHEGAFITDLMHEVIKNGEASRVPILIGINSEELISLAADLSGFENDMVELDKNLSLLVNEDFNINSSNILTVGEKLRSVYTNGLLQTDLGAAIKFRSDSRYTTAVIRHADLQSMYSNVFFYQLSYYGIMGNKPSVYVQGAERVAHAADLNYFWSTSNNSDISRFPDSDILTHNRLIKLWTNFVKHLNPTPRPDRLLQNIIWPRVTSKEIIYLNINETLNIMVGPRDYQKWKGIVDSYGNPPFDTY